MSVSLLDHSDLRCCGRQMAVLANNWGYGCNACGWHLTQTEFLRNSHGTRENRRARIANREVGADRLMGQRAAA